MKLDRNTNPAGHGKYALVKLRTIRLQPDEATLETIAPRAAMMILDIGKMMDMGDTPDSEFFVIRLKDKYAAAALKAYAEAAYEDDPEWAQEIHALAMKASAHANKQRPT